MLWVEPSSGNSVSRRLSVQAGISSILADLLAARGIETPDVAQAFLSPALKNLSDPFLLGGMKQAIERIDDAQKSNESILIFGDYDVDGITSIVLLTDFLRKFGLNPRNVVPHRLDEGYGLSKEALERALKEGQPDLVIAVDCGTSSVDEVAWMRKKGISVIILDHHTSKENLPEDCILVNPHVHDDDDANWVNLCAVGLVFKFCHALLKVMREQGDQTAKATDLRDYLDLVALGTVADLVRLTDENRILVKHGLERLKVCQRPGICSLMEIAGLSLGDDLTPMDIGFRIGPRINASGRLDDAKIPIKLLLSENYQECHDMAEQLDACNRERQDIEKSISERAISMVEEEFLEDQILIVHQPSWHPGVVGIVASRLCRKYNRPAIVLAADDDGAIRGSGRSIKGVNLVEVLTHCTEHLEQWGGHPMAVGLTVKEGHLEKLRECMNIHLRERYPEGLPEPVLEVDAIVESSELSVQLLADLKGMEPFGQGNPEPIFALKNIRLAAIYPMGTDHFRFAIERDGAGKLDGVAWNSADNKPPLDADIDLAVRYHWHSWRGNRSPRMTLVDWRLSGN